MIRATDGRGKTVDTLSFANGKNVTHRLVSRSDPPGGALRKRAITGFYHVFPRVQRAHGEAPGKFFRQRLNFLLGTRFGESYIPGIVTSSSVSQVLNRLNLIIAQAFADRSGSHGAVCQRCANRYERIRDVEAPLAPPTSHGD